MIVIYNIFIILFSILFLPFVLGAFWAKPKLRAGFIQKIGRYAKYKKQDQKKITILVHAVSVGEVNAVENFIKTIRAQHPDYEIVLSTTTKTGRHVAQAKLSKHTDKIVYFPYDFCFSVKNFLDNIQPNKIIVAETEIWPNFTYIAYKRKIPMYIINGRISPSSFRGYKKIRFFIRKVLKRYTKILMQTAPDAQRINRVGAPADKIKVMGNLKFDITRTLSITEVEKLKTQIIPNAEPLLIAASTHSGEDEIVLDVYKRTKKDVPSLKLLIAPRHPHRFGQVEMLLKKSKFNYGKRSENASFSDNDIIVLDTMGELGQMFAIGTIAFIGGSFSNIGGHNPLEANIWDVPVITGPTVFNFKDIYKLLITSGAAKMVYDEFDFKEVLVKFLTDKEFYQHSVQEIKNIFETSSGALNRAIEEIM